MVNNSYSLRPTTVAASQNAPASEFCRSGRKILAPERTPSMILSPQKRAIIRLETTQIKVSERINTFYVDREIQIELDCTMERGKTVLQGSQAPKGFQAAHHSLQPTLLDNGMERIKQRVISKGVTPKKSEPYLRSRLPHVSTPELKNLSENHNQLNHVDAFFLKNAPKFALNSSTHGTYYSERRNATFENPDESNQFDTRLEAHLKPMLADLLQSPLPPQEATKKLVTTLLKFYDESVANLETQIRMLERFHILEKELISFENGSNDQLSAYKANIVELLGLKKELQNSKIGVPSWKQAESRRQDYYWLSQIASDKIPYSEGAKYLKTPALQEIDTHVEKYNRLLTEAKLQQEETKKFGNQGAIEQLQELNFGILDNGKRRAPTSDELSEQIFNLIKRSPKKRADSQRDLGAQVSLPDSKKR